MRMHVVGLSVFVPILLLGLAQESVAFKNEVFFISCLQDGEIDTLCLDGEIPGCDCYIGGRMDALIVPVL